MALNSGKVEFALRSVLLPAASLTPAQKEVVKNIVTTYFEQEAKEGTTNRDLFMFGSAVKEAGNALMAFAQSQGTPVRPVRIAEEVDYAKDLCTKAGILKEVTKPKVAISASVKEEESTPTETVDDAPNYPSRGEVAKMSKKQVRKCCKDFFDVDIEMGHTLPKLRKQLNDLISDN